MSFAPQAGLIETNGELKIFVDQNMSPSKGTVGGKWLFKQLSVPPCPTGPTGEQTPVGLWLDGGDRWRVSEASGLLLSSIRGLQFSDCPAYSCGQTATTQNSRAIQRERGGSRAACAAHGE